MKLFSDKDLKQEVIKDVDLGDVSLGTSKEYTFYLHNEKNSVVENIKVELENNIHKADIQVLFSPEYLKPKETKPYIFVYTPSLKIEEGLTIGIEVSGINYWRPKG
jgi:hypothetical protein